jgi:hypothetical protein
MVGLAPTYLSPWIPCQMFRNRLRVIIQIADFIKIFVSFLSSPHHCFVLNAALESKCTSTWLKSSNPSMCLVQPGSVNPYQESRPQALFTFPRGFLHGFFKALSKQIINTGSTSRHSPSNSALRGQVLCVRRTRALRYFLDGFPRVKLW